MLRSVWSVAQPQRSISSLHLDSSTEIQKIWSSTSSVMEKRSNWSLVSFPWPMGPEPSRHDSKIHTSSLAGAVKSLEPTLDYEYWMLVEQFSMGSTSDCLELFSFKSTRLDLVSTRLSSSLNFDSISLLAVTAFFVRYQYQCEFNFLLRNHRPK